MYSCLIQLWGKIESEIGTDDEESENRKKGKKERKRKRNENFSTVFDPHDSDENITDHRCDPHLFSSFSDAFPPQLHLSLSLSIEFFFFDLSLLSFSRRYIRGVACALTLLSKNLYIETRLFYRLCVERNRQSRHRRVEERERKKKKSVTHDCVIFFSLSSSFLFFFIFLFSFSRK